MEKVDFPVKVSSFSECIAFYASNCLNCNLFQNWNNLEDKVFQRIVTFFSAQKNAYDQIVATQHFDTLKKNGYIRLLTDIFGHKIYFPTFEEILVEELNQMLSSDDFNLSSKAEVVEFIWGKIVFHLLSGDYNIIISKDDENLLHKVLATLQMDEEKIVTVYYSLDSCDKTLSSPISSVPDLSRQRIHQIRQRALRKLRHPDRSRRLKSLLFPTQSRIQLLTEFGNKQAKVINDLEIRLKNFELSKGILSSEGFAVS